VSFWFLCHALPFAMVPRFVCLLGAIAPLGAPGLV
jgi:hypothetical protein